MYCNAVYDTEILIIIRSQRNDQKLKSKNGYVRYLYVSRYFSLNLCPYGLHSVHIQ